MIDRNGKDKIYHANLLKKYVTREVKDEITYASAYMEIIGTGIADEYHDEELEEVEFPPVERKKMCMMFTSVKNATEMKPLK